MGFAVTALTGTLLHFLYEWSGESAWVAPFASVNESTWEHMKLLFWPMLIYAVVQSFFFRGSHNFICIKVRGIILGISLIPITFYIYNGVIGKSPDFINIAIFFISASIAYLYEWQQLKTEKLSCKNPKLSAIVLCAIAAMFVIFTYHAPDLGIFKDPLTATYGIKAAFSAISRAFL